MALVDATFALSFEPVALAGLSASVVDEYIEQAETMARNLWEGAGAAWPSGEEAPKLLQQAIAEMTAALVMRSRRLNLYEGVVDDARAKEGHANLLVLEGARRSKGGSVGPEPSVLSLADEWGEDPEPGVEE